jgi:hypothetical protein
VNARRHIGAVVLAGVFASACQGVEPMRAPTAVADPSSVRFSELQAALSEVNRTQAQTLGLLRPALDALATIDAIVPELADPSRLDAGLMRLPAARVGLDLVDLGGDRALLVVVAMSVDEARVALRRAEGVFIAADDLAYLEATDDVLASLRELSASQDALAQVLMRHLVVYERYVAAAEDFTARRSRFRSSEEAADAFSVESRRIIADIAVAQTDVATFLAQRDAAARDVKAKQFLSDQAFDSRTEAS